MTDLDIIKHATGEVEEKNWGVTQQFLAIHELVYKDNKPEIAHIDKEDPDGTVKVYFPVKGEKFYFVVYMKADPGIDISWVGTEAQQRVYFSATSEDLDFRQLAGMTTLQPTSGWNKGDVRRYGNAVYKFSCVQFMPNPEPATFDEKLNKLLDFLERDIDGVRKLVSIAYGQIQVASVFHNGNTMLGGFHLDKRQLHRLQGLEVEIDFDLYAEGHLIT